MLLEEPFDNKIALFLKSPPPFTETLPTNKFQFSTYFLHIFITLSLLLGTLDYLRNQTFPPKRGLVQQYGK